MSTNPAVVFENVSKKLRDRQVLKKVSFTIERGDVFGYLGPNGAGKTTTIRIMLGLMPATSGRVSILGSSVLKDSTREKVGFVLEADGLYDNLTARDNLLFYSRLYGTPNGLNVTKVLEMVRLADRAGDKVGTFSKGMRQRLALARAMVHDPDLLILDEPTAGVDPTGQIEVREIILELASRGKTVFFSSHNLDEVQRICNRIALIDRGQIKLYGETEKLQRQMGRGEVEIETEGSMLDGTVDELKRLPGINILEKEANRLVLTIGTGIRVPDIINYLVTRGVRIEQVRRRDASLEEIYTRLLAEEGQR